MKSKKLPVEIAYEDDEEMIEEGKKIRSSSSQSQQDYLKSFAYFWIQFHLAFTGTYHELFIRLVKYLLLLRCFVPVPDIIMCVISFYFVRFPPGYINPQSNVLFCAFEAVFKLLSLSLFAYLNRLITQMKEDHKMKHTFDLPFVEKLDISNNWLFVGIMVTYFNILMDLEVSIYFRCFGDNCESVTQNHRPDVILSSGLLRKILEVHILVAAVVSNLVIHPLFTPVVTHIWNTLKDRYLKCSWLP
jgi:hypothetical protein